MSVLFARRRPTYEFVVHYSPKGDSKQFSKHVRAHTADDARSKAALPPGYEIRSVSRATRDGNART